MSKDNNASSTEKHGAQFVIGALAAVTAGFVTNPIDVIKTRLQLQGELESKGTYKKFYKNTFHAAYVIAKHEGIFALQSGLTAALLFQFFFNGVRLGSYNIAKNLGLILDEKGKTDIVKTFLFAGIAGSIGAVAGSPLYLVKTQIQAQSAAAIAVGHQHQHKNTHSAIKSLWKDGGVVGLYRGWYAAIPRRFIGSAVQLTAFDLFSDYFKTLEIFDDHKIARSFLASSLGGTCVAITIQPFDVLATRLYNQRTDSKGKGELYNGIIDGLVKILRAEGIGGLYKGFFPTFMRTAPHNVVILVVNEQLGHIYTEYVKSR